MCRKKKKTTCNKMKEQGWEDDSGFIERVESFITPSYLSLAPRKGRLVWTIDSARRYNGTKKESILPEWLLSGVSAFYFLFSLCSSRLCVFHSNVALLPHEEKTGWLLSLSNHTPHGSFLHTEGEKAKVKNTTSVVATALTERSWWKDDFMLKHEHLYFWDRGGDFI